jgi:predicted transcriptional regulator
VTTFDEMKMATEIVAAFTSHNSLRASELPSLIEAIHAAVTRLAGPDEATDVIDPPAPAVSIRKSVTPDYLICLEDGKRFKSMRRHLALLGMTPEQYRAKWSLPSTYPMVAANYAAQRSAMAKTFGLGRKLQPTAGEPATRTKAGGEGIAALPSAPARRKSGRTRMATA